MNRLSWKKIILVGLAVGLAWGLRGQHGHERGGALVGAMAGLALAAVTGGARWMGAAVIGSLGFAIGGALSYGRFIQPASQGSWEALASLALIGFVWGGLGSLGLGLGLALSRYRSWERWLISVPMFLVWFGVDQLLWGQLSGPDDFETRRRMAWVLLAAWALLCLYVGGIRKDRTSLRLAVVGAVGFAVGFPLAAGVQGVGVRSGIPIEWWKMGELLLGFLGGIGLAGVAFRSERAWTLPASTRPWERWMALTWLVWLLPLWQMANNLDFWISERALLPLGIGSAVWSGLLAALAGLMVWGWIEIRRGRIFATSWMPRHLRRLFVAFVWLSTLTACLKSWLVGAWNFHLFVFLLLASLITLLVRSERPSF